MPLTELKCKSAKAQEKPYRITDGGGMYMEVMPNGSKYWRLKYRLLGKEKRLALGVYPEVSLAEAREARDTARKIIKTGEDPCFAKKEDRRERILRAEHSFEAVAREWHKNKLAKWSPRYAANILDKLETDLFPYIGTRPIAEIAPLELLEAIKRIEKRGAYEVARRALQFSGQVFKYAIATARAVRNPAPDLVGALTAYKKTHFAALEAKDLPEFLGALERNDARLYQQTRNAVRLLMLTFTRTSELIQAKWSEIDLDNARWEIPAERMKMRKPHIVPLSRQAIEILKEQKEISGKREWVFPNQVRPIKPMSNNTILFAIGRLGYKGKMTGHGFRALAMSTIKEKLGYRHEVVDRQLAHAHRNEVDAAYDRAQFLKERTKMMQEWSDYLDAAASEGKVVVGAFSKRA
jgi:integrase